MQQPEIKNVLITGANAGIGKEVARQLALRDGIETVYLACRNVAKARAAREELERKTGKSCFQVLHMDVSDVEGVRSVAHTLDKPIDALVMNAGGSGGRTPLALTRSGATEIFASNVLGHAALLDSLLASNHLTQTAVYLGSEAARGVPRLGIKRPSLPTSSIQDFKDIITGKDFEHKKFDGALAYAEVKYTGALWMAAQARQHPALRLVTISPGNTQGTAIASSMPVPMRILMQRILMPVVLPVLGLAHTLQTGAGRIVDGLTDLKFQSGAFYASTEKKLTGPLIEQSEMFPDLKNPNIQEHADQAVHSFL